MKTVHILQTDKPSRLACDFDKLILNSRLLSPILYKNQNIYITSDEKLPYDSTIFHTGAFYHRDFGGDVHIINKDTHYPNPNFCKRIILTTDESLFKYGVQAIDDEFLEWFVKNPSCEEVEVESNYRVKSGTIQEHNEGKAGYEYYDYKIIIPKEEPKQHVELINDNIEEFDKAIKLFKQETLEEADKRFNIFEKGVLKPNRFDFICGFRDGAKWQMERSYSEEDLEVAFFEGQFGRYSFNDWFEQFKSKQDYE